MDATLEKQAVNLIHAMRDYLRRNGEAGLGECFHGQMDAVLRMAEQQSECVH